MPRYLIQSLETGKFLVMGSEGEPEWVTSLRDAGGGVVTDSDLLHQLIEDNCDFNDQPIVIDLDRLGTKNDYLNEDFQNAF